MARAFRRIAGNRDGAVAPTVAISLFGLVAVGGIAFDYARLAAMDSELQNAADQAALAAASQLDQKASSTARAIAAAQSLLRNHTLFSNDGGSVAVATGTNDVNSSNVTTRIRVNFYESKADAEADANSFTSAATDADTRARFVKVEVAGRRAVYALTPVVSAFRSGAIEAAATAGVGSAICKVPPVMLCNPNEPTTNTLVDLPFTPVVGAGLRLVTGNATAPGNFGWLEAGLGNGTPELAAALGYNSPPGECQEITGVTTKTGMDAAVLNAFNTRFDIFANGNMTCPSQSGGVCSPAVNTRKDLVCKPTNDGSACQSDGWSEASKPYRPRVDASGNGLPLDPTNPSTYPSTMGYPRDLCHALPANKQKCGIQGTGSWDRDAYFKVNYGWDNATWKDVTKLTDTATRWQVYQWETANRGTNKGGQIVLDKDIIDANEAAFSQPATGRAGVEASATQPDRRRISAAVLNCVALNAKGKTTDVPVATWLDLFLVEPAAERKDNGGAKEKYTDEKDIYVETIGVTTAASGGGAGQVVRRDVPYLIR